MGDIQPHRLGSCLGQSVMWSFAVLSHFQVAAILQAMQDGRPCVLIPADLGLTRA